jgi:hypothetical protein
VFSGEQGAHVCSHPWPAPNRAGYHQPLQYRATIEWRCAPGFRTFYVQGGSGTLLIGH